MEFQSPSWDNSSKILKPLQQVPSAYIYLKPKATMSYQMSLQETLLRKNSWDWSINTGQTCWFNNKLKDKIKEVSNVCTTSSHWVTNGEKISEDSSHGLVVIQGTRLSAPSLISNKKPETYSRFRYLHLDLRTNFCQTSVVDLTTRTSWICVKP